MSLVASVVTYTVEPSNAEELRRRVQEHLVPVVQSLPGYHGFLLLDQGDDRRLALLFFETPEQVRQAQTALTPVGEEHTYALMSGPAIGSLARVLIDDGVFDWRRTTKKRYDAIVIGAGQNGLTCACYLARAGLWVLVLEPYRTIGGMTISEELTLPGFQSDVHATGYPLANISPVPDDLDLAGHGVELIAPERVYAHAFPDGRAIVVERDLGRTIAALEPWSRHDAAAPRLQVAGCSVAIMRARDAILA